LLLKVINAQKLASFLAHPVYLIMDETPLLCKITFWNLFLNNVYENSCLFFNVCLICLHLFLVWCCNVRCLLLISIILWF